MKVNVIIHKTSELDDWEEKVKETLEGKVEPLELVFSYSRNCFDILRYIDDGAEKNVVVLAPKKGMGSVVSPVIQKLLERDVDIFFAWYEDAPSSLEDFIAYLKDLLGVKD